MRYLLQKGKEIVGECVVMSETNVVYHLFKELTFTRYSTLKEIKKRYKLLES